MAQEVRERYMHELKDVDVKELAIHRKVNYSRRCTETSAVQAYQKRCWISWEAAEKGVG